MTSSLSAAAALALAAFGAPLVVALGTPLAEALGRPLAVASGAPIVVLCSTDETYPELVPAFGAALKTVRPEVAFVLAGRPTEAATGATFRAAGVDEFIHVRANVREVLATFLKKIGALP